jgi:hypothetical protein
MVAGCHDGGGSGYSANPRLTLFRCHQQLHMDFGFMALFNYA